MTQSDPLSLRAYLALGHLGPLLAKRHLQKRIKRGKEDPVRYVEKLGQPSIARPAGRVIWMHGVGLGEVMALRGLIAILTPLTDAHFLITSGTLQGAQAFAKDNLPRTIHQYLPLDVPQYRRQFLDHWQPDIALWTDQELWPGWVIDVHKRGIPQAIIAGRMTPEGFAARKHGRKLFAALLGRMAMVSTQDELSTIHFKSLGADNAQTGGSLKSAAPPLPCDPATLRHIKEKLGKRFVWIVAPSHPADEALALKAHQHLLETNPTALLIIAPRFPDRTIELTGPVARWSKGQVPNQENLWLADTTGDLGLFYRLCRAAYVGGTNDATEGHNPWEAVQFNLAIFHGHSTANFAHDFEVLHQNNGAVCTDDPVVLANLLAENIDILPLGAKRAAAELRTATTLLAADILNLLEPANG